MDHREELLLTINQELQERGLKSLPKLGRVEEGEIEIVGIEKFIDDSKRFFTDVMFKVVFPPKRTEGRFTVRFNANGAKSDGAIIVALVNSRFAIVKQWRTPLGRWTYEIPRGFGDKLDEARIQGSLGTLKIGDLPLGTMARELGEEVMAAADITSVTHLGNVAENSGTHNVTPAYFLVQIKVDEAALAKKLQGTEQEIKVLLWTADEVRSELGRRLCDNHSITAVALSFFHIAELPRIPAL